METALIALILNDAIVGASLGTRVYWGRKPQEDQSPVYAVLLRIDGIRDYLMAAPSGYVTSRVQCDCYGQTYEDAKTAARAVQKAIGGFLGLGINPALQGIFIESERDLSSFDAGDVHPLFRISTDFIVHHAE